MASMGLAPASLRVTVSVRRSRPNSLAADGTVVNKYINQVFTVPQKLISIPVTLLSGFIPALAINQRPLVILSKGLARSLYEWDRQFKNYEHYI